MADEAGSPVGRRRCKWCHTTPSSTIRPCGHGACKKHNEFVMEDNPSCDHCGEIVIGIDDLTYNTPSIPSANSAYTYHHSSTMPGSINDGSKNLLVGLGSGIGPGMSNNKYNLLARKMEAPSTPTPSARNRDGDNGNMGKPVGPYVPPQLRNDPISRPDSSLSTSSFASQVPPRPSVSSPHGSDPFRSEHSTPVAGNYRYTANNLPHRFSQLTVYENQDEGFPPRRGFNFDRSVRQPPMNSDMYDNSHGGVALPQPPQPGDDHATKAAKLAAMIKAGMTEDRRDPDYGNPGPSRRVGTPAKAPFQKLMRGDIVAGSSSPSPSRGGVREIPNLQGNAVAFLNARDVKLPPWFSQMAHGYQPTFEEFMQYIPLIEACTLARPSTAGVIQITNIPYGTSRSEITALLGSQAKICAQPPGTGFLAVHILMERQSGKTLDAYVEVESGKEARMLVSQFAGRASHNRPPKLGDRAVEVNMSSRDAMMAEIFPRAKNTTWIDGVPKIDDHREEYLPGVKSTGFIGFLQDEEIYHLTKHAETPQRSPFAQRCLIRTYECLITTIYKYPWFAIDHVLEAERLRLFDCTKLSIRALINLLSKTHGNHRAEPHKPTSATLKELAVAALVCPGFTEKEKAQICADLRNSGYHQLTRPQGMNIRFGGNHPFAEDWPFKVAAKLPGANDQLMEYFASLLRDATRGAGASLNDLYSMHNGRVTNNFGAVNVDYTPAKTLGDAARIEVAVIQGLLSRVLPRGGPSPGSRNGTGSTGS